MIDDSPECFADELRPLGEPTAVYRTTHFWRVACRIMALVCVIFPVLLAFLLRFAPVPKEHAFENYVGVAVFGGLLLFGGVPYFLIKDKRLRSWRIWVFPSGFAEVYRGRLKVFRWDEVRAVWQSSVLPSIQGIPIKKMYQCTVQKQDGDRVSFGNNYLRGAMELGNTIYQATFVRLLNEASAAFGAGSNVEFGQLQISSRGLTYRKKQLPWNEIDNIKVRAGRLYVRKKNKLLDFCEVPIGSVSNFYIFLALVNTTIPVQ